LSGVEFSIVFPRSQSRDLGNTASIDRQFNLHADVDALRRLLLRRALAAARSFRALKIFATYRLSQERQRTGYCNTSSHRRSVARNRETRMFEDPHQRHFMCRHRSKAKLAAIA
jgi:hypothetical protein